MNNEPFPKAFKAETKPHKFCPGCGHPIVLKALGQVIDELKIQDKTVIGLDIGCSLLAGDFFDVDSLQTHHGRTIPTMVGFKRANPKAITLAYMGDGGAYAIGAQHLVNAAMRDDKITTIVVNNTNYAMTGGQAAPTTLLKQKTTTTPAGRMEKDFGFPMMGPEMVAEISQKHTYVARGIITKFFALKEYIARAIKNQVQGKGFSLVEVLSICPTNWKTDAAQSLEFLENHMTDAYRVGEIKNNSFVSKSELKHES